MSDGAHGGVVEQEQTAGTSYQSQLLKSGYCSHHHHDLGRTEPKEPQTQLTN